MVWAGLGPTNAIELAGGTGIALAGAVPWLLRPRGGVERAFALLALAVGLNGILASLAESAAPSAPLAGALVPYCTFGGLGAGAWLCARVLLPPGVARRAVGVTAVALVLALSLAYARRHDLWGSPSGLGPMYLALGARYLMHASVALALVVAWRRGDVPFPLALGFLFYAVHETARWYARVTLFPWGASTPWADASFALRLLAVAPLVVALFLLRGEGRVASLLLLPVATTLAMRLTVSEGVFSTSGLEVFEVEAWRTAAYVVAAVGVVRSPRAGDGASGAP